MSSHKKRMRVEPLGSMTECALLHLIMSASIKKSISSCSEQISGRVCGAEESESGA